MSTGNLINIKEMTIFLTFLFEYIPASLVHFNHLDVWDQSCKLKNLNECCCNHLIMAVSVCLQVYEAVPCQSECGQYEWVADPWSVCTINTVDELPACGEGVQSRKIRWARTHSYRVNPITDASLRGHDPFRSATLVLHILILLFFLCDRCVRRVSGDPVSSVNETLCDQEEIPPQAQTCLLPCPDDCVMSQWSQWSTCSIVRHPLCLVLYPEGTILKLSNIVSWPWCKDQHTEAPKCICTLLDY